jgi:hypothetical protein
LAGYGDHHRSQQDRRRIQRQEDRAQDGEQRKQQPQQDTTATTPSPESPGNPLESPCLTDELGDHGHGNNERQDGRHPVYQDGYFVPR